MEQRSTRPPRSRAIRQYQYQRTYQACLPCARRKVKCSKRRDDESCERCEKKRIQCVSSTKRPWSRGTSCENSLNTYPSRTVVPDEAATDATPEMPEAHSAVAAHSPSGDESRLEGTSAMNADMEPAQANLEGELSASVLDSVVSTEQDAIRLLFKAAAPSPYSLRLSRPPSPTIRTENRVPLSDSDDALRVWNACRFVRMGWFTAQEAISLVEWFFTHLSPLSPVLTDFYGTLTNQFWLVTQEPFLCCTVLLLASRYYTLPGAGGRSRSSFIHHRLSQHCQHLLLRVMLGQEKFSKAKTRTIGTIEALLLLCEWYPKSLHFPPESDGWDSDLIMTDPDSRDPHMIHEDIPSVSSQWQQEVVEPTKRLERMSWMILSAAVALAYKLGVFDPQSSTRTPEDHTRPDGSIYQEHLELRRKRLPPLLWVFSSMASVRIGCDSLISPDSGLSKSVVERITLAAVDEWWTPMGLWVDLMHILRSITYHHFTFLREATDVASANFLIEDKRREVSEWQSRHVSAGVCSQPFNDTLFIEYQHVRIIINSIGMQERLTRPSSRKGITASCPYTDAVIDGCTQTLEKISNLSQSRLLRYMPVRVFFRMVSSSIFLLKALALGAPCLRLRLALQTLRRTIGVLQEILVEDELHLGGRYATLLETVVTRLRKSLLRVSSSDEGNEREPVESNGQDWMARPDIVAGELSSAQTDHLDPRSESLSYDEADLDLSDDQWLSLPFETSMAPFGSFLGDFGVVSDGIDADLDFLWNLPP
ncbi:hypothetical protein BO78DRAFT_454233 [Aspergillus sclerotiicarbonarius CBS 121057]|uniref:Zn(2)-C6 fungal-type domain-containing protein n=1 Tax=Aspergillus sclerotiicarbonarius (strain CBS 121057 / IBT 28362) TaxID=1448318 RepID=A0A319DX44_ASPSB|nr:hypothetical protein BO78DRAFT_454233 [Aspergillus sclerotiicarbonarius CBS 121057]